MIVPLRIELPTPFMVGPVNSWLLLGDEPALVDVGPRTDAAWEALLAGLAAHGLTPRSLCHIFLTHSHIDHYGNGGRLAEAASGAQIYAPDLAHARPMFLDLAEEWERQDRFARRALQASGLPAALLERGRQHWSGMRRYADAVPVTRWVRPGDRLPLADGIEWEVVGLPGHSMTQVGLRQAEAALFIVADHLLPRISSNALLEPPPPGSHRRSRALPRYMETLRWTAGLPPQQFFPGHGLPFTGQRALIEQRLREIEERAARLLTVLRERPCSVMELVAHLFPRLRDDQLFLAISEVVGHLDLLEERALVAFRGEPVREYYAVDGKEAA